MRLFCASSQFGLFEDRFRPVLQEGENDTGCSKTISLGYGRISSGKAFFNPYSLRRRIYLSLCEYRIKGTL